jgi:hypothetical protein
MDQSYKYRAFLLFNAMGVFDQSGEFWQK